MVAKILVIVFAFIAGAGGAFAYQLTSGSLGLAPQEEEDSRIAELEGRLAAAACRIEELEAARQADASESEVLIARINTLAKQFSEYCEKQGELAAADEAARQADGAPGAIGRPEASGTAPAAAGHISGEVLVAALKDMPDEGKEMIRKAIHQEVQRIRKDHESLQDPRARLGRDAGKAIKKLAHTVALSPVQIEQAREIATRHIERAVEAARVAKERNDPGYAQEQEKQIWTEAEREVISILTPEQLDKLREKDPDGIGKRYPRGF